MVRASGVVSPSSDFLVGEASGGGLNVDVAVGEAYIKGATTNAYPVRSTTVATQEITANSAGNPRIDALVLYIDLSETPDPSGAGDDIALLTVVEGTPASSPVAPSDSAVQADVGASNPFLRLANITIADSATGISEANISNVAKRVFMQTYSPIYEEDFDATWTPDYLNSNKQKMILSADTVLSEPDNMEVGDIIQIEFLQDGTGGYEPTWFETITWLSADYSINTDANATTVYIFEKTGDGIYKGYLAGKEY
jgi:hypothetical protein